MEKAESRSAGASVRKIPPAPEAPSPVGAFVPGFAVLANGQRKLMANNSTREPFGNLVFLRSKNATRFPAWR
jgi:hypothetical protein